MENIKETIELSPPKLWPLLAFLVLAVALWQAFSLRSRTSLGVALLLASLRTFTLAAVLIFIMEPSVIRQRREDFSPILSVAIDDSLSMSLRDGVDASRLDRVRSFLLSGEFREAADGYYQDFYAFSEGIRPVKGEGIDDLDASGRWTDLSGTLESLIEGSPSSLGAVVVFTDGGHGTLGEGRAPTEPGRGVPVFFVGVGGEGEIRDAEVARVGMAGMAFAGKAAPLTVEVRARGFAGRSLPLLLKESGRVVLSEEVSISSEDETKQVELQWVPPRPGSYHLSAEVPPQAGEEVKENNRIDVALEASRDKIRMLLVSGRPSWNHRFLRDALKGDPSIDLVSFIILRTATDAVNVPQEELSLIPFPTKKIFLEELSNFDIVVFENFSFRFYFPAQYLERVRDYVAAGGAFWMLGGPLSFGRGGYVGTPLEEVLPVEMAALPFEEGYVAEAFHPRITPAGARHPFFRGLAGLDPVTLPEFEGYNPSGRPREGAVSLIDRELPDGVSQPIFVTGRYGSGRTLAALTDSLWRWNFELAGRGVGNYFYLSLFRQAVRWSVGDPQTQPVIVRLETDHVVPGETIRGTITVLGEDYLPDEGTALEFTVRSSDGSRRTLPVHREAPGLFSFEASAEGTGTMEVEARAVRKGVVYGEDRAMVRVAWPSGEYVSPGLNRKRLVELGRRHGGGFVELGDPTVTASTLRGLLDETAPAHRMILEEKRNLGDEWWAFSLLLAFLAGEWTLRKRRGLD